MRTHDPALWRECISPPMPRSLFWGRARGSGQHRTRRALAPAAGQSAAFRKKGGMAGASRPCRSRERGIPDAGLAPRGTRLSRLPGAPRAAGPAVAIRRQPIRSCRAALAAPRGCSQAPGLPVGSALARGARLAARLSRLKIRIRTSGSPHRARPFHGLAGSVPHGVNALRIRPPRVMGRSIVSAQ